jgi:hypothetical protein
VNTLTEEDEARLREQVLRVYRRYAVEVVEALGFCPYAERCRKEGHTRELVALDETPTVQSLMSAVHELANDKNVEVGLILLPRVKADRLAHARFVEQLRRAHQDEPGGLVMAMEGFHPEAAADLSSPEKLVPFVRRTPDPTIQLVRLEVLNQFRRNASDHGTAFFDPTKMTVDAFLQATPPKPLHVRIAEANFETTKAKTVEAIQAIYEGILRDRQASYGDVA